MTDHRRARLASGSYERHDCDFEGPSDFKDNKQVIIIIVDINNSSVNLNTLTGDQGRVGGID